MTDKEIIKAFEHCRIKKDCKKCPLERTTNCMRILFEEVFSLLNRQQAEIERLTVNMNAFGLGMKRAAERADTARAEAIKEFAERLTHTLVINNEENTDYFDFGYTLETIDNLVKEMTGETKTEKCDCFCEEQRIKGWLDGNTPITEPITVCNGTRERDECTCGGDKSKCDFYAKDYSYGY